MSAPSALQTNWVKGRKCYALATVMSVVLARTAMAQTDGIPAASTSDTKASQTASSNDVERRFLRVEPAFWSPFGVRLSIDGRKVGPGLLAIVPDEAVKGSDTARRHAVHARIDQGIVIGSAAATIGLLIASVVVRGQNNDWTPAARGLGVGAVFTFASEILFASLRDREFLEAVNAYNYDLVRGYESQR